MMERRLLKHQLAPQWRQEQPRPTTLHVPYCIVPGEVFRGLHRQHELCPVQGDGFALLAFNSWQQELGQERRAVPAVSPVPLALIVLCHGQGVPCARCTITGKTCFYFCLKQLPTSMWKPPRRGMVNEEEKLESQAGPCAQRAAWHASRAGPRERLSWPSQVDGVCRSCRFLHLPSCFV